jgi:AraC-like DNA-binding protein
MTVGCETQLDRGDSNWNGTVFLWQEQALFLGKAADTSLHTSPAIKICVAIDGEIRLRTSEDSEWESFQAAIIAPGQVHAIDCRQSEIAMLILVPEAELAQPLSAIYNRDGLYRVRPSAVRKLLPVLDEYSRASAFDAETENLCLSLVESIQSEGHRQFSKNDSVSLDPRVVTSIEQLRAEANCGSVGQIAANVALSESRFSHLFSEQLGVPVRRYLLWLRLRDAMHRLATGATLTETAYESGFADSAHLTRTFRGMLGIAPSSLLRSSSLIPAKQ